MARAPRQQVDDGIIDRAAALFAQHGFAHTSVQAVADAVGLSKAGLLHHFPSKEALFRASVEVMSEQTRLVRDRVAGMAPGPARDRRALELLTDIALARPGLVSLALAPLTAPDDGPGADGSGDDRFLVSEIFAVEQCAEDTGREIRVLGALSALAVLSLTANRLGEKSAWRQHIITTCVDALGHADASGSEV